MATNGNGAGYDVIIIGTGPGGYVTAIRAAQLGLRTAVVEDKHFGGICLNWGCIPTKALLRSAEVYDNFKHAKDFGLKVDGVGFDMEKVVSRSRAVSKQLNGGVGFLLKKNKVDVIWGTAKIAAPGIVTVETEHQLAGEAKQLVEVFRCGRGAEGGHGVKYLVLGQRHDVHVPLYDNKPGQSVAVLACFVKAIQFAPFAEDAGLGGVQVLWLIVSQYAAAKGDGASSAVADWKNDAVTEAVVSLFLLSRRLAFLLN